MAVIDRRMLFVLCWAALCGALYLVKQQFSSGCHPSSLLFASRQQERNADNMYRRQQNLEYRVLAKALDPQVWQIPVAVEFDASIDLNQTTHRPRLVWDLFG